MPDKKRTRDTDTALDLARFADEVRLLEPADLAALKWVDLMPGRFRPLSDPGQAVIRSDDFLSFSFALVNLDVVAPDDNGPATLKPRKGKAGYIVLHFAPQSISEEVFYQRPNTGIPKKDGHKPPPSPTPSGSEDPRPPPIQSRIANHSRAVFRYDAKRLAKAGMDTVPYTLEGILAACTHLQLSITANAGHSPGWIVVIPPLTRAQLGQLHAVFAKQSSWERARILATTLRNMRLADRQHGRGAQLLMRRAEVGTGQAEQEAAASERGRTGRNRARKTDAVAQPSAQHAAAMAMYGVIGAKGVRRKQTYTPFFLHLPGPTKPSATQTSLELPYRLILSPNETGRFIHSATAQTFAPTGYTALWHTRLGCIDDDTGAISVGPGSGTEVRAIWARTGPLSNPATFNANWPHPDQQPGPDTKPFRMTLDDRDRFNIVHESSNFRIADGHQEPIDCKHLMLSALGGWLDLRGAWKVPDGLSVEEWIHQSTQARDHYVRVVYKGYLCPFGHRVSLVKVSERKFHHDKPGNAAYLRQRMFLIVREPLRQFPTMGVSSKQALPGVPDSDYPRFYHRQFPFSQVRCLTRVTPDLQLPANWAVPKPNGVDNFGAEMFWPFTQPGAPFRFHYVATDLDGKDISFELPGIFIDNALANPADDSVDDRSSAETNFETAQEAWFAADVAWRSAQTRRQSVCMAPSAKPGDTACEIDSIEFGVEVDQLRHDPATKHGPLLYPSVWRAQAFIPSVSYLGGANTASDVAWNQRYAGHKQGFHEDAGEVFLNVLGGPNLDFSKQGNRSGGLVQPNLAPSGLSRLVGPVAGDVAKFAGGKFDGPDFFSVVNPLLFGCIPLGELLHKFSFDAGDLDKLPKFITEAADAAQTFFNALGDTGSLLDRLERMAREAAIAALEQAVKLAFEHIKPQIEALDATTAALAGEIDQVIGKAEALATTITSIDDIFKSARQATLDGAFDDLQNALDDLLNAINQRIAQFSGSGLSSTVQRVVSQQLASVRTRIAQVQALLDDLKRIPQLIPPAEQLGTSVGALLVSPDELEDMIKNDPGALQDKIEDVGNAFTAFKTKFDAINLFAGGVRNTVDKLAATLHDITDKASAIVSLLSSLLGDEITIRFDWNPTIQPWPHAGNSLYDDLGTLFNPHDTNAFVVGVEARIKKSTGAAKINVHCGLRAFDLVLLGDKHAFIKLTFEKIEFRADSSAKMDVDVKFDGIQFVGPLQFVETLRDLIPLDGFSDPPALSISEKGIDASFSMALPNLALGMLNLSNLSLGAGFTVPFIGQPLSVRFNFCTRDQPFCLTVAMFGGGGFFGITIDPHGVQLMEAAFEFGAAVAVDFGVASGGVHVMAGIYFRIEKNECKLTGYFRMGGHVSVLGIVSVAIELYLALSYDSATGKAKGEATLTISVSVFMFSVSASIHCERQFAGSNGDPSFAALMGPVSGSIDGTTQYPWRTYVEAFA